MKIVRAKFQNFRLLRSMSLNFSTDKVKKLTVIRAENETGKTTILTALQWALYGDDALPNKGQDYRLHPIDWDIASDGARVPVSAEVEFETTVLRHSPGNTSEKKRRYLIIRTAHETLDGAQWDRTSSTVKLFRMTDTGSNPIDPPDAHVREELPPKLREVFFTDGDRALNFIEAAAVNDRRERVQKAIRSLLGLDVVEDALKHIKKASSEVNSAAKKLGTSDKLTAIAGQLEEVEQSQSKIENNIESSREQFTAFDEKLTEVQKKIDAALVNGDREQLKRSIDETQEQIKQADSQIEIAAKEHAELFKGMAVACGILTSTLERGLGKLSELHAQGKIPNATIPVLEERLRGAVCICGESLSANNEESSRRRTHVQSLIEKTREADELQGIITDLYFGSRPLKGSQDEDENTWLAEYAKVSERRGGLDNLRNEQGRQLKALEVQLDEIPDTDIQGLREVKRRYSEQRDRFNSDKARDETKLEALKKEREGLVAQRDNLLREQKKGAHILAELEVTQDIEQVLRSSYEKITNEELAKVSKLMNSIFLEMIGADPEQGAIIQRAHISKDFDILVYGPGNRVLNPDRDLNGASRRALTLAFILALTRVSEVEAPNVIDTPLGMMSGFVKQSVLKTAVRESSQIILFLTRSEIADCEEILDAEAGLVVTLTNSAHYPRMLVNDPQISERTVLQCECNHRQECTKCQRHQNVKTIELGSYDG